MAMPQQLPLDPTEDEPYIKRLDIHRYLPLGMSTIDQLIRTGKLRSAKVGRSVFTKASWIRDLTGERAVPRLQVVAPATTPADEPQPDPVAPPKRGRGRPKAAEQQAIDADKQARLLRALVDEWNIVRACKLAETTMARVTRWRDRDPRFRRDFYKLMRKWGIDRA